MKRDELDITTAGNFPAEVRLEVKALARRYNHLLPRWCAELRIIWQTEPGVDPPGADRDEAVASCIPSPHYRQAAIEIYPLWLEYTEVERRRYFIHELRHVITSPLAHSATVAVNAALPRPPDGHADPDARLRDNLHRQIREAWEAVTQDLTLEADDDRPPVRSDRRARPPRTAKGKDSQ